MAWMRMMGAESVDYHRETVLGRADDHPARRSPTTPAGRDAAAVGRRRGAAGSAWPARSTDEQYEAIFGPGGARHPVTGERLAATKRPGMELVVAAHKSVAVLGVIGRAEDMHRILDAERDATLAYLDAADPTSGAAAGAGRRRRRRRAGWCTPTPATPPPGPATRAPTTTC